MENVHGILPPELAMLDRDIEYSTDLAHIVANMVEDIVALADRNGVGRYLALYDVCASLKYIDENANLATYRQTVAGNGWCD